MKKKSKQSLSFNLMKINFVVVVTTIFLFLPLCIKAQEPDVTVQLFPPPPNQWRVEELWNLILTNNSDNDYEVYLSGTVKEDDLGLVFEGTSAGFTLHRLMTKLMVPRDFESGHMEFVNEEYKDFFFRTGTMKDGLYKICIDVIIKNTSDTIGHDCLYLPIQRMMPPELLYPMDDSEVFEPFPVFMWLPPMPLDISFSYEIRIAQIFDDQTVIEALQANPALFIQTNISETSFQLPVFADPFEFGEKYAWQISAYDVTGGLKIAESEVWGFKYESTPITPPGPIAPDCELFTVEFRKEISNDSLFYKLSIINKDTLASTELLPHSFSLSMKNDSIIAFDRKIAMTWEQNPASVSTPVEKITWKYKSGCIPEGKTYIGNIALQGEPENSFWVIYSWNDKDGKVICQDSVAFNQTICYHNLSMQLPRGFVNIYDSLLNIRFVNNYAPANTLYVAIYDATTLERVVNLQADDLLEYNSGFIAGHGLNKLTINLNDLNLEQDKVYLLTIADMKNYHFLKFKTQLYYEEQ